MTEKNRVSRLSGQNEWSSQITTQPLDDVNVRRMLNTVKDLVYSARGPNGRLKFFQTSSGGHVTVTSTSSKILHSLSGLSHPILRLILFSVKGHLDNYGDGGLQTALLLVSLVQSCLDLPVPRALFTQISQHSLEVISNHLQSCRWKMKIDVGNLKSMLSIVNSIIGTKPACHLSESDARHVGVLIIKAFLHSLPRNTAKDSFVAATVPAPVQMVTFEGDSVKDSKILEGVLLQAPNIPTFQHHSKTLVDCTAKVALFNISMAGDTNEWFGSDVRTEAASSDGNMNMTNAVLQQMIKVADWLMSVGVQVIACQKCVHPAVKQYLRDRGAFVVDRLSILHISAVQRLTGATILSTFSMEIPETSFGKVEKVKHVVLNDKSFIHLLPKSPSSSSVCTLLLCSPDETSLEELKIVCQAAMVALNESLVYPFVVPGAGCFDTHLASVLRQYAQNNGSRISEEFGCTKGQFVVSINNIAHCLESLARSVEHDGGGHVTDSAYQHHWSVPPGALKLKPSMLRCLCRLVSRDQSAEWSLMGDGGTCISNVSCESGRNDPLCANDEENVVKSSILDMFSVKMNSYRTSFETASAILRVHCVVCSSIACNSNSQ